MTSQILFLKDLFGGSEVTKNNWPWKSFSNCDLANIFEVLLISLLCNSANSLNYAIKDWVGYCVTYHYYYLLLGAFSRCDNVILKFVCPVSNIKSFLLECVKYCSGNRRGLLQPTPELLFGILDCLLNMSEPSLLTLYVYQSVWSARLLRKSNQMRWSIVFRATLIE